MSDTMVKFSPSEGGLALLNDPQKMLDQAKRVCDVLMKVVEEQELYQKIGDKRHLLVEAWEILGHFYGVSGKIVDVRPVVDELTGAAGFEATADAILISTGMVISSARSLCLNNEQNWSSRPKYEWKDNVKTQVGEVRVPTFQISSMSQTRALGKVLSNVLRFIPALAGYSGTPAEEMTGDEHHDQRQASERKTGKEPERKSNGGATGVVSEKQRGMLFAIAKEVGCPMNDLAKIWQAQGFDIAANITREKFDAILKNVREWKSPQ